MISISHSRVIDCKIWLETAGRWLWLRKHGYDFTLSTRRKRKDFSYAAYTERLRHFLQLRAPNIISDRRQWAVYLTPFGTYGRYQYPNQIFVNIVRTPEQAAETVIHEIAHLLGGRHEAKLTHAEREHAAEQRARGIR